MNTSRAAEISELEGEIGQLEDLRDYGGITEAILQTKTENVLLEVQLAGLVEKNKLLSTIKMKLDEAVRRAHEKEIAERRALVDAIMAGVMKELQETKLQDRIMKKSIAELERIPLQQVQI